MQLHPTSLGPLPDGASPRSTIRGVARRRERPGGNPVFQNIGAYSAERNLLRSQQGAYPARALAGEGLRGCLFHQTELGGHDPHSGHRHRAESAACGAAENVIDARGSVHFCHPRRPADLDTHAARLLGRLGAQPVWGCVRGLRGRSQLSISTRPGRPPSSASSARTHGLRFMTTGGENRTAGAPSRGVCRDPLAAPCDAVVLRPVRRCGWRAGASRWHRRLRP
jgi:hypothetical protein